MPTAPVAPAADNDRPSGSPAGAPFAPPRTKLFAPAPRPDWVPRPRLDERIAAGLRRKLVLLAAPPGYGKTAALAAWRASSAGRAVALAWVSLDAGDNDPVRFWTAVVAALAPHHPAVGERVGALLPSAAAAAGLPSVLADVLADLPRDIVLVLDDIHAIDDPDIHRGLTVLLDRLPPRLHLIVAGRADPPLPLARLRANGDLAELRAADLRFTADEAAALLVERRGLALEPADIAVLAARTEGWAAALHLAALSLQDRADAAAFVRAFAGSHRYLVDYLAEEVLDRQPPELRDGLLRTAVLDRLCGPLCDAVLGTTGGQALLERLERANLFLVPLDDGRAWYRYHHLFADVLRARLAALDPAMPPLLHARAAAWFEAAGMLPEAVGHALAAADPQTAARLIERVAEPMWRRGELVTLLGWLDALPKATVLARPRLAVAHAGARFLARSYDADAVEALLADAEASLAAPSAPAEPDRPGGEAEPDDLRGTLAAIRAAVATTREDGPAAVTNAGAALAALPPGAGFWRVGATLALGLGRDAAGDTAAADAAIADSLRLARAGEQRYLELVATMNLARIRAAQGRLRTADDLCRDGFALAAAHGGGGLPVTGYLHVQAGKLAYERNDLPAAARHFAEGIARVRAIDEQLRVLVEGYAALARVRWVEGDPDGAAATIGRCERAAEASRLPWAAPLAAAYRARHDLRRGDVAAVARWAETAGISPDDDAVYAREHAHLTLARLMISRGDPDAALSLLGRLRTAAAGAGRTAVLLEIDAVLALAHAVRGEPAAAAGGLARALAVGEPEGFVRSFLDEGPPLAALLRAALAGQSASAPLPPTLVPYARRLLAAFGGADGAPDAAGAPLPEPLTPREREVLALLADGLSNPEIAARLFVGVGTVKTHVNGIFAKLPATSRTQAVARARTLGLLPA